MYPDTLRYKDVTSRQRHLNAYVNPVLTHIAEVQLGTELFTSEEWP